MRTEPSLSSRPSPLLPTEDFIIGLFLRVDAILGALPKDPRGKLYPSEIVTLALLFAIKGVGNRAFYRWLLRDWLALFPGLPDRTRLFRLFAAHQDWTDRFLADPTFFGVADTYGIELIHPAREGRSGRQIGKKGLSNHRWIVGGKLAVVLNSRGEVCGFDCGTANVYDGSFQPLVRRFDGRMIVLADGTFHVAAGQAPNLKVAKRKTWGERIVVETMLSMLTVVCHLKKVSHRVWRYFTARLAYTVAAFNLLLRWHGPDRIRYSIAEFGL
jgi:hypothetical protein